jgi:rare lipoprotein A
MKKLLASLVISTLLPVGAFAAPTGNRGYRTQTGVGSTYGWGDGFHGRRTASGERFNQWALTAASRSLPFGTLVRVTNTRTGRSVVVRINDRGPFTHGRIIDISTAAARQIGMDGVAPVRVDVLQRGN